MTEKIVDINRKNIFTTMMFHFKNSLRPFICSYLFSNGDMVFVDIKEGFVYQMDELENHYLEFYRDEEDDDFLGVAIIGEIDC